MGSTKLNFEVDTSDYLGFLYEEYINDLQALAMSKPSDYYTLRRNVLKALKQKVVEDVYKSYYGLLTTGKINNVDVMGGRSPSYPQQLSSKFALSASKTVNEILDKCLEIVLPENHLDVANLRLNKKGSASQIDV